MKLLFSGASGFLGNNIISILKEKYDVRSMGLTTQDDYQVNIAKGIDEFDEKFDIVIHAAGKAHSVSNSKKEKDQFFQINFQGTKNFCAALERNPPKSFIFISTVAVYGVESGININEEHALSGTSAYALSKILAEKYLETWCSENNIILSILRPSLIAGKNPPGNLGAMIKGIKTGNYYRIGSGTAHKSILMAEDIARLIPKLTNVGGIYNVCANHHPSFAELEVLISNQLQRKNPKSIPYWIAKSSALIGDILGNKFPINSSKLDKLTQSLTFSNEKAKRELDWEPLDVLQNFKIS